MPNPSPTVGLARAALNFAQKGKKRQTRGIPADAPLQHALALTESMGTFAARCSADIRADSIAKLAVFFEIALGKLIDTGKMGWIGERVRRPFVLECVTFLADTASAIATQAGNSITPLALDEAARTMIHAKKPRCPLPAQGSRNPLTIFGSPCTNLARLIGKELIRQG